jgi:hypothetical protein
MYIVLSAIRNAGTNYILAQVAAILATLIMTYLACHPILAFIRRGWVIKRQDILSSMNTDAKRLYLKTFLRLESKTPDDDFDAMYTYRYGRYRLIAPVILLVCVLLPALFLVSETAIPQIALAICGKSPCPFKGVFLVISPQAVAAIIGAYTWVAFGLVSNAARYNLPPPFVLVATLRMVVAVPLGYAVGALAAPGLGIFLAFAVGVFPLETVQTILQRIASKNLKLDIGPDPTGKTDDQVTKLDGIDPPTADRLQDADITTVPQLAYCDPVQLSMRTNFRFDAVVDMVDQALAWIYLGDKLAKVRPFGLRGAMEIHELRRALFGAEIAPRDAAQRTLDASAAEMGLNVEGLKNAFEQIAGDPYTLFLIHVWPETD